ncbi:unnamed protein product [Discosporangium mesarthrocarpum]
MGCVFRECHRFAPFEGLREEPTMSKFALLVFRFSIAFWGTSGLVLDVASGPRLTPFIPHHGGRYDMSMGHEGNLGRRPGESPLIPPSKASSRSSPDTKDAQGLASAHDRLVDILGRGARKRSVSAFRGGGCIVEVHQQKSSPPREWTALWPGQPPVAAPTALVPPPVMSPQVAGPSMAEEVESRGGVGLMVKLCLSYMSCMAIRTTIPSILSAIALDPVLLPKEGELTKVIGFGCISGLTGKFVLGVVSDRLGGIRTKRMLMVLMAASAFGAATSRTMPTLIGVTMMLEFCFSGAWGCATSAIREEFPEKQWAKNLGLMASGSRTGMLLGSLFSGLLLNVGLGWRWVMVCAGVVHLLPPALLLNTRRGKAPLLADSQGSQKLLSTWDGENRKKTSTLPAIEWKTPGRQGKQVLEATARVVSRGWGGLIGRVEDMNSRGVHQRGGRHHEGESMASFLVRCAKNSDFWLMLCAKAALTVPGLFAPVLSLFLTTVYGIGSGSGAVLVSAFPLGGLLSNTLLARKYGRLRTREQIGIVAGNLLFCTACSGALALHTMGVLSLPLWVSVVLLFLWGFNFALPYYIPSGIFALRMGGQAHSAFMSNVFDAMGYMLFIVFNSYALTSGSQGNWAPVFSQLSLLMFVSGGLHLVVQLREAGETASPKPLA